MLAAHYLTLIGLQDKEYVFLRHKNCVGKFLLSDFAANLRQILHVVSRWQFVTILEQPVDWCLIKTSDFWRNCHVKEPLVTLHLDHEKIIDGNQFRYLFTSHLTRLDYYGFVCILSYRP